MSEPTKLLCKECIHSFVPKLDRFVHLISFSSPSGISYKCSKSHNIETTEFNPVTGYRKIKKHYDTCFGARLSSGVCGPFGSLWLPKHKKDLFLTISEK